MRPIEYYMEHTDELAQKVEDDWEKNMQARSADFQALFDKATQYLIAKRVADKRRGEADLERPDAVEKKATQQAFAKAYKMYEEKQNAARA